MDKITINASLDIYLTDLKEQDFIDIYVNQFMPQVSPTIQSIEDIEWVPIVTQTPNPEYVDPATVTLDFALVKLGEILIKSHFATRFSECVKIEKLREANTQVDQLANTMKEYIIDEMKFTI